MLVCERAHLYRLRMTLTLHTSPSDEADEDSGALSS